MPDTTCVGRLSPIEVHESPPLVDIQTPPLEAAAKIRSPLGSAANDVTRPERSARPSRVEPLVVSYSVRSPISGVLPYGVHVPPICGRSARAATAARNAPGFRRVPG